MISSSFDAFDYVALQGFNVLQRCLPVRQGDDIYIAHLGFRDSTGQIWHPCSFADDFDVARLIPHLWFFVQNRCLRQCPHGGPVPYFAVNPSLPIGPPPRLFDPTCKVTTLEKTTKILLSSFTGRDCRIRITGIPSKVKGLLRSRSGDLEHSFFHGFVPFPIQR